MAQEATLYVVLHGELALFDSEILSDPIQVFAPEVDVHVYSAGPWLGETRVPKGLSLVLGGVQTGQATLSQSNAMLLFKGTKPDTQKDRHMQIELPRPDKMLRGCGMGLAASSITVTSGQTLTIPPDGMCLNPVFQYRVMGTAAPALSIKAGAAMPGMPGMPAESKWVSKGGMPGFFILHIYAEADMGPSTAHIAMAFQEGAALLGVSATFTVPPTLPMTPVVQAPTGLLLPEMNLSLAQRMEIESGLGAQMHDGHPMLTFGAGIGNPAHTGASSCGPIGGTGH